MAYLPNVQENAQAALPVIPNNGNPGGAYNMPQTAQVASAGPNPNDPMAWMQPPPAMTNIQQLLHVQTQNIIDQVNNPYKKGQFNVAPDPDAPGWLFKPVNDYGLPIYRDSDVPLVMPLHDQQNTMPSDGIVLPEEYKDKLRNGQIY